MRALFGSGQWILGSGRENRGGPSVELWVVCVSYSAELRARGGGSELDEKCSGGRKVNRIQIYQNTNKKGRCGHSHKLCSLHSIYLFLFPRLSFPCTMPYSHQTDTDSGATLLELPSSQPHNSMASHDVYPQSQLRRQSYGDAMEQDVGLLAPGPAGYHYDTPYEDDDGPGRDRIMTTSPSIGPWDSASQRSLPYHSQQSFPLPQPSHMPLAGNDTLSSREKHFTDSYNGYEDGEYYHTDKVRPRSTALNGSGAFDTVEMGNVRPVSSYDDDPAKYASYHDHPSYPYPPLHQDQGQRQGQEAGYAGFTRPSNLYSMLLFPTGLDRLLSLFNIKTGAYPVEQAIERKKRGLGGQKYPVAAWSLTAGMYPFETMHAILM